MNELHTVSLIGARVRYHGDVGGTIVAEETNWRGWMSYTIIWDDMPDFRDERWYLHNQHAVKLYNAPKD